MKTYTQSQLLAKAQAYCSSAEHCPSEVMTKLKQWGCNEQLTATSIIQDLTDERFIDETRYSISFVRDKYRLCAWGKLKIALALKAKGLPSEAIEAGIGSIDEEEYDSILGKLIEQKDKSLKYSDECERRAKLMRYASSKGFTLDEISRHL